MLMLNAYKMYSNTMEMIKITLASITQMRMGFRWLTHLG